MSLCFLLGKSGVDRVLYLWNFYRYIIRERFSYDVVFMHMTPIYILLGALLWKLVPYSIALWYNHSSGGFLATIAAYFSNVIFVLLHMHL